MVTPTVGRRERNKAATRQRIIECAMGLFAESGIERVTVDQIAAHADVGKGTIYNYFTTKEDVIVAFMADFEGRVQEQLARSVRSRPLAESLVEFLHLQFKMKEPHYRFVRVFLGQMFMKTEQFLPHMARIHALTMKSNEALFERLKAEKLIRSDIPTTTLANVLTTIQLGLTALWAVEGPPFTMATATMKAEIALFCEGLERKKR